MQRVAECRACGAPMIWARTGRGKNMPVDAEPSSAGTFVLEHEDSPHPTVHRAPEGYTGPKYTSHFATCPNADDFRRKKDRESA